MSERTLRAENAIVIRNCKLHSEIPVRARVSRFCRTFFQAMIRFCTRLDSNPGLYNQRPEIRLHFLAGCSNLTTIDFKASAVDSQPSPAMAALGGVPPATPSRVLLLQYLDLTDCLRISDAGLLVIVRNAPHLLHLYLRRCINISGEIWG